MTMMMRAGATCMPGNTLLRRIWTFLLALVLMAAPLARADSIPDLGGYVPGQTAAQGQTLNSSTKNQTQWGFSLGDIASALNSFGGGAMTSVSTAVGALQGIANLISIIPGLGGVAGAINSFLDGISGVTATLAPIVAVAKTVGSYMTMLDQGATDLNTLMGAKSLEDVTASIQDMTGLAGQAGLIDTGALQGNAAGVAQQVRDTTAQQIQAAETQKAQYAQDPAVQSAIDARIARLKEIQAVTLRKVKGVQTQQSIQGATKRASDLAASTASSAMLLTTAAATVTNEKDAGKVAVAAMTEGANATASGLANLSGQLAQQSALTLGTNESLDTLVQQSINQSAAQQAKFAVDVMRDDLKARSQKAETERVGVQTAVAIQHTFQPRAADNVDFQQLLRNKK